MTAESAAMLVSDINNILVASNEEDQTTGNLGIVSGVLEDVVGLLNEGNFSVDEDVRYIIVLILNIIIASVFRGKTVDECQQANYCFLFSLSLSISLPPSLSLPLPLCVC